MGLRGYSIVNGVPIQYFSVGIQDDDRRILELSDTQLSASQQALKALAMLVALRQWFPHWCSVRSAVTVRSDNTGTLAAVARMQPKSRVLGIISRELALDIASATYDPEILHIPGVANLAADILSRRYEPSRGSFALPPTLDRASEITVSPRDSNWWKSL